jgi:hypothetical protein
MPSITTASIPVTDFPYRFVFPFNDDGVVPLYSAINFINPKETSCLPCCVCGTIKQRSNAIAEQASRYKNYVPNQTLKNQITVGAI